MSETGSKNRILQLLPSLCSGDAISMHALALSDALCAAGVESEIYTDAVTEDLIGHPHVHRLPKTVPLSEAIPSGEDDGIVYHMSIASRMNAELPGLKGHKGMIYHNITPPHFFDGFDPSVGTQAREGYAQLQTLLPQMEYVVADSEYNLGEIRRMGYAGPGRAFPIRIPFEDYRADVSPALLAYYDRFRTERTPHPNVLFVGRVAPNKKQEDLIRCFETYRRTYSPEAHLWLAGSFSETSYYTKSLKAYIESIRAEEHVHMTGGLAFEEILALYRTADAFLCLSEHEGFCVPLVEAMFFDLPIVAYDSTAVGETLAGAGVLLGEKSPETVAAALHRVLSDEMLRRELVEKGRRRLEDFTADRVTDSYVEYLIGHTVVTEQ